MSQKRSMKSTRRRQRKARRQDPPPGRSAPHAEPDAPDLLGDVDEALRNHPIALLTQVSGLLTVVDPRMHDPFEPGSKPLITLEELVGTFVEVDLRETTALLSAVAALTDDELLAARIRRALSQRRHDLPSWLRRLAETTVYRVVEMTHVLGDGDNVILGARLPTGEELCAMVYVDHNVGTLVKDAFLVPDTIEAVLRMYVEASDRDPDTTYTDIDPAEARAKVTDAIATAAITYPSFESESWPMCRPLVEWLIRMLPSGGQVEGWPVWKPVERKRLAGDFFASSFGIALDDRDHRDLLDTILWFGCDYTGGDPLRWSNVRVEVLLADWLPRKVLAGADYLALTPDLLRAFVRYAHHRLGIRPQLTEETLAAVDEHTPELLSAVRDRDDRLRRMGAQVPTALGLLDLKVGGREALLSLDDAPLPDEPFDWTGIPDDIRPTVAEVLRLADAACGVFFDVEARTACRRLLRRAAAGDPQVFRRRAKAENAAAAICWLIGSANGMFSWGGRSTVMVKDLLGHFGIRGSVKQRGDTLLRAAGIDTDYYGPVRLGDPDLLVGAQRAELIAARDRHLAAKRSR